MLQTSWSFSSLPAGKGTSAKHHSAFGRHVMMTVVDISESSQSDEVSLYGAEFGQQWVVVQAVRTRALTWFLFTNSSLFI